jgi:hypothetical protein
MPLDILVENINKKNSTSVYSENLTIDKDIFEPTAESTANDDDPFQNISFSNGSYGKANLEASRQDLLSSDFKDIFSGDLNRIPNKDDLMKYPFVSY